jgi:hypothetical protein
MIRRATLCASFAVLGACGGSTSGNTASGDDALEAARKTTPFCADDALSSEKLQPGPRGGPDARSHVKCDAGFALCRIDPDGKDNDVCGDPTNCFACSRSTPPKVPMCKRGALGSLQPGPKGGPDARSRVSCEAGFALCRVDPDGSDNDVCGDPTDCFACTR